MNRFSGMKLIGAAALVPFAASAGNKEAPRPNIIVVLTDDMGYSDIGCYGGEIQTPNIDNLAENGIRWRQFYNNARSCPSRAVLMTGLYPHQAGMGWMACADEQTEAYHAGLNDHCVTIAEVLSDAGYETYMLGKWHLCSERQCKGDVTERWPTGRGFQHFYGFPEGASHYFHANMVSGDTRLPKTGDDFYLTDALSDSAAAYVRRHDFSDRPMFMYLSYNAPHWPLHAHPEDIRKYVGTYRAGWDRLREERFERQKAMGLFGRGAELSPRDANVPAWDSLSPAEQEDFTMRMAIYAAQVDAVDQGVGKLVQALKDAGEFENTVIMFMDDNGACAEDSHRGNVRALTGQADTWESYHINWANLSSTPYREYKHYMNEGGIASPLIVCWPGGIASRRNGSFVDEYGYFADIMATCVDLSGATYPDEYKGHSIHPMEGVSLVPNFRGRRTGRGMTFWEHEINIAVRDGKWKLNILNREATLPDLTRLELYNMKKDPTELHNLAARHPKRARKMFSKWVEWAERVGAYPLCNDGYGPRHAAYRRVINGGFEDNFGDWTISGNDPDRVLFSIDRENVISGSRTARVQVRKMKPGDGRLCWNFPTVVPMSAKIGFTYRCDAENSLTLRMENAQNPDDVLLARELSLSAEGGTVSFDGIALDKDEKYLLILDFGNSREGTVWLDDVVLELNFL